MPLESGTTISALDSSNPAATDGLSQADDHIRLVKAVLKATFPNWTGVLTASHTQVDAVVDMFAAGPVLPTTAGTNSAPTYAFATDPNNGMYLAGTDNPAFTAGGIKIIDLTPTGGNVTGTWSVTGNLSVGGTLTAGGVWRTGDVKLTMQPTAESGWLVINDQTIGNVSSGATFADATAQNLYTLVWNQVSDTYAPVTGGRGGSAAADWAAQKKIALTKMLGRALAIAGAGSGLTSRALGQVLGEETHVLSTGEMPSHTHTQNSHTHGTSNTVYVDDAGILGVSIAGGPAAVGTTTGSTLSINSATATNQNTGGGAAHENMPPTAYLLAHVKL